MKCQKVTAAKAHTIYSRNNMDQKCEGNCGLWVRDESNPENLKKIVGAVWELPSTANPAHFHSNWAGLAVLFSR